MNSLRWYYLIGVFLIVIILRFITNFYKYQRIKKLYQWYTDYLKASTYEFAQNKEEIIALFKEAGLKDSGVYHQEPLGYGNFANVNISIFENMTSTREDIVGNIKLRFNEAIGVFKKRYCDSFNPIFWIDFFIKLPQYALGYLGVLPEKIAVKIVLIVYWILALLFGLNQFDILDYLLK